MDTQCFQVGRHLHAQHITCNVAVGPAAHIKSACLTAASTNIQIDWVTVHADRACLCAPSAARAPRAVIRKKPLRGTVHVSACPQKAKRAATASALGRCAASRPLGGLLPSQTCTNAESSDSYAKSRRSHKVLGCVPEHMRKGLAEQRHACRK